MRKKDTKRRNVMLPALGLSALILGLSCSCGGKKKQNVAAEVAIVPGANLIVKIDAEGIQNTPIHAKLEAMSNDGSTPIPTDKVRQMQDLAKEKLGIEKDAMDKILFSADLSGVDFSAPAPPNPATLNLLAALQLKSPVSLDDIRSYLQAQAESEDKEIRIEEEKYKGTTLLFMQEENPDEESDSAEMPRFRFRTALALQNKGKLVLVGTEKGVKGALERAKSSTMAKDSAAMAKSRKQVPKDAHFYLAFVPTKEMRTQLKEQAEKRTQMPKESRGNPMMAQSLQSASTLQSAAISMAMDEKIDFALQVALTGEDNASQLKTVIDSMMISGLKMAAMQFSGGQGMPFTDTIQLIQKGEDLTLRFSIGEEDLETAAKGAKQLLTPMSSGNMPPPPPPQTP